jgi:hypothetical protein
MNDMTEELSVFEASKEQVRNEFKGQPLFALVQAQAETRDLKEKLEAELSIINARYDVLRYELVPAEMEEMGIERVTYEGIGRVSLTADLFVSTKTGAKEQLFGWLEERHLADIIQPAINPSTLKAFIKNRMQRGEEVPADMLNISPVTRASITKR